MTTLEFLKKKYNINNNDLLYVGAKIKQARCDANLSQEKLAELIGTSKSVISRLENDDYKSHTITTLIKIANALDLTLEIKFRKD